MSGKAVGWAKEQNAPCRTSKALLICLADYADAAGECFPPIPDLAQEMQVCVRTVQRCLARLVDAGLLERVAWLRENGSRTSDLYRLPLPKRAAPRGNREGRAGDRMSPGAGDKMSPGPVTTVSPANEHPDRNSRTDVLETRARAGEISDDGGRVDGFGTAFAAYPQSGRERTDIPAAEAEFPAAVAELSLPRLVAAIAAYAASPGLRRSDYGAPGFHKWLKERRFRAFVTDEAPEGSARAAFALPGLWADVVASKGEAWAGSWLAPCGVDGRVLHPARQIAADRLKTEVGAVLAAHGVTIGTVKGRAA